MLFYRKSIFDIIKEADDDNQANGDTGTDNASNNSDNNAEDANTDTNDDQNTDDDNADEDNGDNENFDIDTDLDDDLTGDDNADDTGGQNDGSTDTTTSSTPTTDEEDEPVKANTNIFNDLSAEEQSIKIKELKTLYRDLYTSCDDLLNKINDINPDEDNLSIISRVSLTLYSLKQYIEDYLTNFFASKSYIENDIIFNRFLTILNSTSTIIDELAKIKEEKIKKDDKK